MIRQLKETLAEILIENPTVRYTELSPDAVQVSGGSDRGGAIWTSSPCALQ